MDPCNSYMHLHGRLKFTVVSEPMDAEEECVDVGHAFLDLQELLLTGNDVIEREIDSRRYYNTFFFICVFCYGIKVRRPN